MGRNQSNTPFSDSKQLYERTYLDYFNRFKMIVCDLFKWENLPEGMSERFLEKVLFEKGNVLFFKDNTGANLGLMICRTTPNGRFNHQEEPTGYYAIGINYYGSYALDDCVVIRNNVFSLPSSNVVELYCQRLTEIERTAETNVIMQKTPWVILCDEKERLSFVNIMMKVQGNEPVIFGTKGLNLDSFKVFPTLAPYVADKLQEYKESLINEFYTRLGLNNANTDKKERLIVDEVNSNNEVININFQTMLQTRQQAVDEINKMFGLKIKVSLRYKEEPTEEGKEGENNGELHGDDSKSDSK